MRRGRFVSTSRQVFFDSMAPGSEVTAPSQVIHPALSQVSAQPLSANSLEIHEVRISSRTFVGQPIANVRSRQQIAQLR
jgi:hypothetical protein